MPSRYLIVEDHPLFAEALLMIVRGKASENDVIHVKTLKEAKAVLDKGRNFDLVLLDLRLPDSHAFEGLIALRIQFPKLPIVVVSAFANHNVKDKVAVFGAAAFISKAAKRDVILDTLAQVAERALHGQDESAVQTDQCTNTPPVPFRNPALTQQQLRVLQSICLGLQNKQIARELDIAETTVKAHVSEILRKLNVSSRTQAVLEVSRLVTASFPEHCSEPVIAETRHVAIAR